MEIFGLQTGTLAQWVTAGAIITLIGVLLKYRLGLRQIIAHDSVDIRDHYAQELVRYRSELNATREELSIVRKRQSDCEGREEALRRRVRELEDHVAGLQRQISQYSANKLMILEEGPRPSSVAPEATASAPRVKDITEEGDE